jgi:hypothetical protein
MVGTQRQRRTCWPAWPSRSAPTTKPTPHVGSSIFRRTTVAMVVTSHRQRSPWSTGAPNGSPFALPFSAIGWKVFSKKPGKAAAAARLTAPVLPWRGQARAVLGPEAVGIESDRDKSLHHVPPKSPSTNVEYVRRNWVVCPARHSGRKLLSDALMLSTHWVVHGSLHMHPAWEFSR